MAGIPATRVIDLQPGKDGDALCCFLRSVRLDDGPEHEALSYTWKGTAFERAHVCRRGTLCRHLGEAA